MPDLILNRNDKEFAVSFTVKNKKDGSVYDLTGHTIKFHVANKSFKNLLRGTCVITDAINGKCKYTILVNDLSIPKGHYLGEVELSTPAGLVLTNVKKITIELVEECG